MTEHLMERYLLHGRSLKEHGNCKLVFIRTKMFYQHVKCLTAMCDISINGVHTQDLSSYYQIIPVHLSDISFCLQFVRTPHHRYRCDRSLDSQE